MQYHEYPQNYKPVKCRTCGNVEERSMQAHLASHHPAKWQALKAYLVDQDEKVLSFAIVVRNQESLEG